MSVITRGLSVLFVACLFLLLGVAQVKAVNYYVATTGNNANDGLSQATAWRTVTYAGTKATAGDTVYIRAGLYHDELVTIDNSGTENAPIIFQGYTTTPGDTPNPGYTPGDTLDSTILPVLENLDPTIRTSGHGSGIAFWAQCYIEIRNLGVTNFNYGIFPQMGHHVVVENAYVTNTGGHGIWSRDCDNVTIRNCVSVDAGMCNILSERTRDILIENCKSYSVNYLTEGTDYHIVVMDSQNVFVRNCQAYNTHSYLGGHAGHGIGIKDASGTRDYPNPHSTNVKIIDCAAYNMGEYFFCAHEAYGNVFENCTGSGQYLAQAEWSEGINIRDGAHDNTFRNCRIDGIRTSLTFQDTLEGPRNPDNSYKAQICQGNIITNCVFSNSSVGVQLWNADYNVLSNCVFDGIKAILVDFRTLYITRTNPGNVCQNSIVTNTPGRFQGDWGSGDRIAFTYSNFWGNGFPMPAGTGNLAQNPLFADAANGDYHLKSAYGRWSGTAWVTDAVTSPCIDAGDPTDDSSAEPAPNGGRINIGAYGGTVEASKSPGTIPPWGPNAGLDLTLLRVDADLILEIRGAQLGDTLAIQTSPDLVAWTTVETRTVDEAVETYTDTGAGTESRRFYRVLRSIP